MKKITAAMLFVFGGLALTSAQAQEVITQEAIDGADLTKGKRVFLRCRACHTLEEGGRNKVGPNLWGVFSRQIGTQEKFKYSKAVTEADFQWTPDKLNEWLMSPKKFLPGNKMSFVGLNREADRINLLAYLLKETAAEESGAQEGAEAEDASSDDGAAENTDANASSETGDEGGEEAAASEDADGAPEEAEEVTDTPSSEDSGTE